MPKYHTWQFFRMDNNSFLEAEKICRDCGAKFYHLADLLYHVRVKHKDGANMAILEKFLQGFASNQAAEIIKSYYEDQYQEDLKKKKYENLFF